MPDQNIMIIVKFERDVTYGESFVTMYMVMYGGQVCQEGKELREREGGGVRVEGHHHKCRLKTVW